MDALVDELLGELNCETVFTIPLFGGIPINESIVVTWIMMAAVLLICLLLTRNLKVNDPGKGQLALEGAVQWLYNFFDNIMHGEGRQYYFYLIYILVLIVIIIIIVIIKI